MKTIGEAELRSYSGLRIFVYRCLYKTSTNITVHMSCIGLFAGKNTNSIRRAILRCTPSDTSFTANSLFYYPTFEYEAANRQVVTFTAA